MLYGTRAFGWRTDPPAYRAKQVRCTTHQPTRPLEAKRRLELLLVSYGRSTTAHASSGTMISWWPVMWNPAAAAVTGGALDDVDARAVMVQRVQVAGGEAPRRPRVKAVRQWCCMSRLEAVKHPGFPAWRVARDPQCLQGTAPSLRPPVSCNGWSNGGGYIFVAARPFRSSYALIRSCSVRASSSRETSSQMNSKYSRTR